MLIVARTPFLVGSTSVTLPIVIPRYVTFAVRYSPPEAGRCAYNLYCPMPNWDGKRR
ncbi:hypothetical protein MOKP122_48420 [Mycobacterium avium subsp. hominissuis]